jgi:hypothetical protein
MFIYIQVIAYLMTEELKDIKRCVFWSLELKKDRKHNCQNENNNTTNDDQLNST